MLPLSQMENVQTLPVLRHLRTSLRHITLATLLMMGAQAFGAFLPEGREAYPGNTSNSLFYPGMDTGALMKEATQVQAPEAYLHFSDLLNAYTVLKNPESVRQALVENTKYYEHQIFDATFFLEARELVRREVRGLALKILEESSSDDIRRDVLALLRAMEPKVISISFWERPLFALHRGGAQFVTYDTTVGISLFLVLERVIVDPNTSLAIQVECLKTYADLSRKIGFKGRAQLREELRSSLGFLEELTKQPALSESAQAALDAVNESLSPYLKSICMRILGALKRPH